MRWTSPVTVGLASLAVGFVAGYSIPRDGGSYAPGGRDTATARPPAATPGGKTVNSTRAEASVPRVPEARPISAASTFRSSLPPSDDPLARQKWAQNLPTSDIPSLVTGLCADLGPEGLPYEDRGLIDSALQTWWEKDSAALLDWLKRLPNSGTKRYLVSRLLAPMANDDPSRAAALAESFKAQDPEWNDSELQDTLVKKQVEETWKQSGVTADDMLQLYSRFSRGRGTTGERVGVYPLNFDFRKFLDGMAALSQQDGKSLAEMPSDALEAWAKVDPQAAVQWLVESQSDGRHRHGVTFADWEDIANGIAATSGPQAYHQWAADIVVQPQQSKLRELILQRSSDADLIGIIEKIGNVAQRDEALATAVGTSNRWRNENDIEKLAMISTPEGRLRVIAQNPDRFESWIKRGKTDPSFWPRAGLSPEQVNAVLTPNR